MRRHSNSRFERHPTDRAISGTVSHNFRMHRTRVFDARGCVAFEGHAALGARARLALTNLRIHRTNIAGTSMLGDGSLHDVGPRSRSLRYPTQLNQLSSARVGGKIVLRIGLETLEAALAAEEIPFAGVFRGTMRGLRINIHSAHRIENRVGLGLGAAGHGFVLRHSPYAFVAASTILDVPGIHPRFIAQTEDNE